LSRRLTVVLVGAPFLTHFLLSHRFFSTSDWAKSPLSLLHETSQPNGQAIALLPSAFFGESSPVRSQLKRSVYSPLRPLYVFTKLSPFLSAFPYYCFPPDQVSPVWFDTLLFFLVNVDPPQGCLVSRPWFLDCIFLNCDDPVAFANSLTFRTRPRPHLLLFTG